MAAASCVQVGSLGFKNTPPPRRAPCPTVPMSRVSVVIVLNSVSIVTFQQGRVPVDAEAVHYLEGVTEDSWGKASRRVKWDRHVPAGSFLKIIIDTNANVFQSRGSSISNKVELFQINGMDATPQLETVLRSGTESHVTAEFRPQGHVASLDNLPCNLIMTIGPIDNKTFT